MQEAAGSPAHWVKDLRSKPNTEATRKLLKAEDAERYEVAERIQHDIDRTTSGNSQSLKLAEHLSMTMPKRTNVM